MTESSRAVDRLAAALLDRYRIERELGAGGMATVYLAEDLKHDRQVAIKVLRPELAAVIGADRFLAEIKTTANLQHPHILPLFDSGEADGFLYYVMPYIDGESLRELLDREKQLGVEEAVRIAREVGDALEYAHGQGVIHRDIKPANILLHRGRPVVADFGIAVAISAAGGGRMTETGLSLGTPHYMSPEQASADRDLSARSDVYSLGCVLYEMIAGQPPHTGPSAQSVLVRIMTETPRSLTEVRHTVPLHVASAVAKAVEKLPADRFESAQAFAAALEDPSFTYTARPVSGTGAASGGHPAEGSVPGGARGGAARGTRRNLVLGAAAVLLATATFVAGRASVPPSEQPVTRFRITLPEGVSPLSVCCGPIETVSPDGEWLVFVGTSPEGQFLFRRRLEQLDAEVIPGTEDPSIPFFSPDGRWVGFHSNGRLRKVPMNGGPPVPIADLPRVDGASWGDNGLIVFAVNGDSLYTVPAAGGEPVSVAAPDEGWYVHPWMLPGGTAALARIQGVGTDDDAEVAVIDLDTGEAQVLAFGTRAAYASGYLLISGADGTLLAQPFDPRARRATGSAVAILDGLALAGPSIGEFAPSRNGGLVYWSGGLGLGENLTLRSQGSEIDVPLPEPGNVEDLSFSPDGRRIAMRLQAQGGVGHVWIWDREQRTQELLTVEGDNHFSPVWSPDGGRIAFSRDVAGTPPQIFVQPIDGSGPAELVLDIQEPAIPNQFTADGRALLITSRGGDGDDDDVGLLDLDEGTIRWLVTTPAHDYQAQISPDGRWLAYTSNRSGQAEVYVQPLEGSGGRVQVSVGGGSSPRWAPAGEVLYFATGERQPLIAATVSTDGGFRVLRREETLEGPHDLNGPDSGLPTITWDLSPDGEEFAVITRGGEGPGRPSYVWILNWPEVVRQMQAGAGAP
jgi:serine/threonine-protein kinase